MAINPDLQNNDAIQYIAATVHGEMRNQPRDAKINVASSIFNRYGQREWKHMDLPTMVNQGYYAVRDAKKGKNTGFDEAMSGKFKNKTDEDDFRRTYAIVASIAKGTLEPTKTQFYYNQNEINRLIKNKKHDFKKTPEVGSFEDTKGKKFRTFAY
jgi:hypothetical protein